MSVVTETKPECSLDDCARASRARGYCNAHYKQFMAGLPFTKPRGDGYIDKYGYRKVFKNGKMVREHRYIMEQHLGRKLLPGENVHHKNGVRHDNDINNLELWIVSQPQGQRPEDLVAWAKEIIARYDA